MNAKPELRVVEADDAGSRSLAELQRSCPDFLKDIDRDPDRARADFLAAGYRYLVARPPRAVRRHGAIDPHDFALDLLVSLVEDDCRQLRSYQDRGRPFVVWLARVAQRRAVDVVRRERRGRAIAGTGPVYDASLESVPTRGVGSRDPLLRERVRGVFASFRGSLCHQLLTWRLLHGYSSQEITSLLNWPADRNGDVSDRYNRCRRAFLQRLAKQGITERDLLSR